MQSNCRARITRPLQRVMAVFLPPSRASRGACAPHWCRRWTAGARRGDHPRMEISVVAGDLLDQDVEVIVNAWNRNLIPWWLLLPQGVSGAIKRHAGTAPFRELAHAGLIPLGGAVLTGAGKLPFRAIIHVAGINLLWLPSERATRGAVRNALAIAARENFRSIAFPLIGAGVGGLSEDAALELMQEVAKQSDYIGHVRFVRYKPQKV